MLKPAILFDRCWSCYPCLAQKACKTRAIMVIDPGDPPFIAIERCSGCGECVKSCPAEAVTLVNGQVGKRE